MRGGPKGAAGGADIEVVVDEAEDGLEEEERDADDADYGVGIVELFKWDGFSGLVDD